MKNDSQKNKENLISHKKDLKLIKETLKGNSKSFAELVALYKARVTAVGMSFFHNKADCEDFEQEVFLKVYKNLPNFRGESRFSTWLTRIAYTTAVYSKNKNTEYETLADETVLESTVDSPEKENLLNFTKQAVREAIKELPQNYAICLDFYFFYDFSLDEIAIITGFPVNTIKSHIFRAKKILAQKLKDFAGT